MGDLYPSKRVVLLLDDLQRADMNSITLIKEALIASQEIFGFFTYRENEEDISAIEDLQRALSTANVHQLTLSLCPLNEKSIQEIIIEMIGSSSTIVEPLAILIKQKTKGNPFFVRQVRYNRVNNLVEEKY
jgi:predicted ATPase